MTSYLQDPDLTLYNGDVLEVLRELPDESVQMCVTSPPYWGLRDYSTEGQLGLEPTPEAYVAKMVEVFRKVRRVLRRDGTLWLNIGDSYATGGSNVTVQETDREAAARRKVGYREAGRSTGQHGGWETRASQGKGTAVGGLKPKDLCMIPARLALALQADGWYLRSEITWVKPNPMPESVTDRPTQATEKIFMLTKLPRYFYDAEAVREPHSPDGRRVTTRTVSNGSHGNYQEFGHEEGRERWPNSGRNLRNWWQIATEPYPEAHFATYPTELVRRCILAGTSERGCCPECRAPWVREIETSGGVDHERPHTPKDAHAWEAGIYGGSPLTSGLGRPGWREDPPRISKTLGWRPSCDHGQAPIPQTILDCFFGSGTTGLVARRHGRKCIGVELSESYCALAAKRLQQLSLLAEAANA